MLVHLRALCMGLLAAAATSCMDSNRIIVHEGKIDDRTTPDVGDEYDFERLPSDAYTEQKPGFYLVHSDHDWLFVWNDPRPDAKPPPPPQNVDYKKKMIFVATASDEGAKSIEVQKVMSLYSGLHIYVLETLMGPNCPAQAPKRPMDIVELDTVSYDVHVHVDRIHADTCGPPPDAVIACRVAGSGVHGSDKIAASVGDTIDCDGSKSVPRIGSIIDRSWQLLTSPPGSMAKLAVGKGSMGVTFPIDAWGTYSVGLSVHDAAREGSSSASVEVPAPENAVELYWSHVPRSVDLATLPRVELHVVELPGSVGVASADCDLKASKPWCEMHTVGAMQQVLVRAEPGKRYRVSIKHLDERRADGPVPCVRTFPRGAPPVTSCDAQETVRKANAIWDLGALDPATGSFYDARLPKPPAPPPSVSASASASASPPAPTHTAAPPPPPTHAAAPPPPPPPTHTAPPPPPPAKPPAGGTELEL